jgi:GDP-mannose 6-dehydrogenase
MVSSEHQSQIAVLGLGYVGCVTAACLAASGYQVFGVDRDEHKVRLIQDRQAPFYEPGLEDLVREQVAAGRLSAMTSLNDGIREADIALICVGTPSERNGNPSLDQLTSVVREIADSLPERAKPLIVVVRSTVFPGTCEEVVIPALRGRGLQPVEVVFNPEFLREGAAVKDFREPSLVIVGGTTPEAAEAVARLYASLDVPACLVSIRTAEMIKYACNAFHAAKISFANEIGALADKLSVPAREVLEVLCRDEKLNISAAYLRPGFAFGGPCLPKDLRALHYRASRLDLKLPMLESILVSNQEHLRRAIQATLDLGSVRLGVVGLAFKEHTDDLRESPVVALLEHLIGKGRDIRIYDSHIQMGSIYGSNRDYVLNAIPHIGKLLMGGFEELASWAERLVVTQRPSPYLAERIANSGRPVLDLARVL